MSQNLALFLKQWGQSAEDPAVIQSSIRVLLAFELYQPNIGYVPGLEKIVYFLRKLGDEPSTFLLLFNFLFNSRMIWGYLDAKKTITEQYLAVFEKLVQRQSLVRKSYELNKTVFDKFFLSHACYLYLDVFDPSTVEKIFDHLVVYGEAALFTVGALIIEEAADLDFSEFGVDTAVKLMTDLARKIDPIKVCHRLLTAQDDYEFFLARKRELVK